MISFFIQTAGPPITFDRESPGGGVVVDRTKLGLHVEISHLPQTGAELQMNTIKTSRNYDCDQVDMV